MTLQRKDDNALREQGEVDKAANLNPKRIKKIDRVEAALRRRTASSP